MSTEHQRYSTENQAEAIAQYAARRGFEIVQTYEDSGRSGLTLNGRQSLQQLLADVRSGAAEFSAILVYDISRWGRFQDADESAYYEFVCREAGISVHYCAEQFENDGSISATIIKSVKRAMAGEYSRELSVKVFAGQCRLVRLGYRQGGPAGYGLRRQLLDEQGAPKGELRRGEQKSLQTDRVVLGPGPPEEVEVVRRLYRMFVVQRRTEGEIATILNGEGLTTDTGRPWTRGTVHQVLTNEKYVGNNVFNRVSNKLKARRVVNPPDMWVRADRAFPASSNRTSSKPPSGSSAIAAAVSPTRTSSTGSRRCSPNRDGSQGSSSTRSTTCRRARSSGIGSAACSAPTSSSGSRRAETTGTSRPTARCGRSIRTWSRALWPTSPRQEARSGRTP
jgi:DNA invertase Pin-like site-specific DNA recombinase